MLKRLLMVWKHEISKKNIRKCCIAIRKGYWFQVLEREDEETNEEDEEWAKLASHLTWSSQPPYLWHVFTFEVSSHLVLAKF